MSNPATVLVQLRTACQHCFTAQINLLDQTDRVSQTMKVDTVNLFIYLHQLNQLGAFPDPDDDTVAEIASVGAISENVSDEDELAELRDKLASLLRKVGNLAEITEADEEANLTGNLLNKRMVDQLYLMAGKIRSTRRRLNDAGGGYDREAYAAARNKATLAHHTYLGLLNNDSVFCTHPEVATLERTLYPALDAATVDSFVSSIEALGDFLQERILA